MSSFVCLSLIFLITQLKHCNSKHLCLQEDGDAIPVRIVRTGGALVTRYIEYFTTPGDPDEEFYGGIGVLKFDANENFKETTLIARSDGVPEVPSLFFHCAKVHNCC